MITGQCTSFLHGIRIDHSRLAALHESCADARRQPGELEAYWSRWLAESGYTAPTCNHASLACEPFLQHGTRRPLGNGHHRLVRSRRVRGEHRSDAGRRVGGHSSGRLCRPGAEPQCERPHSDTQLHASASNSRARGPLALSLRFAKSAVRGPESIDRMPTAVEAYFRDGGQQVLIFIAGTEDMRAALPEPEAHRSLMVRVGGFSAYFAELDRMLQEDMIALSESEL
ncbi:MAG: glycine radical domain-containing protein [Acidobacteriota bacterium]|nr:glycine radical domain-containing protein [Acidobacteriota bacterium]